MAPKQLAKYPDMPQSVETSSLFRLVDGINSQKKSLFELERENDLIIEEIFAPR